MDGRPGSGPSPAPERGRPLLEKCPHALLEVARRRRLLLDRRFEFELLAHAGEQPGVELLFDPGVGASRPGRQPRREVVDLAVEPVVGRDAVD
jgi:hypothetical protein